ncbi:MAG: PQQ-binding-like beta-propeller repeat protein [Bacteroidetes bacterium]|nr:PQQ-binding-like beta-propeller repeat protein [Bacteroidota bacterium]
MLLDSLVVVSPGGTDGHSLVAYHKGNGEQIWSAGNDQAGYSSPLIATIAEVRQILIFNWQHVVAHDPGSGKILWKFPWTGNTQRVAQPVVLPGDRVFITTGYGVGSKLIQIDMDANGGLSSTLLWESNRMKAKFSNVIAVGEFIYGLDDGILVCIDLKEGKRQWKRGRYGHGQMILVDDLLLITTEKGDVVLVEPNPEEHKELARFTAIKGKTWNNPALAGPYLLVRNSQEAACYELPLLE